MDMGDAENVPKEDINMKEILAYGMGESKNSDGVHVYSLYAVFANSLLKCSHVHDHFENKMTAEKLVKKLDYEADRYDSKGGLVRATVTTNDFIISCADCTSPTVRWFDHDLDLIHSMEADRRDIPYELATFDQNDLMSLQTYIAGQDNIAIMLQVTDEDGKHYFKKEYAYSFNNRTANSTLSIDKGSSYLVFKHGDEDTLSVMPTCDNDARFDEASFTCKTCDQGLRSWGLQSDECVPCIRVWLSGGSDEYKDALYQHLCLKRSIKSTVLLFAIPITSAAIIIIICCNTRDNGFNQAVFG